MRADITAFKLDRVDYAGALTDPLGALLMAGSWSRASLTMVDGRIVVRDSVLTTDDETGIAAEGNQSIRRLLAAAGMQGSAMATTTNGGGADGF